MPSVLQSGSSVIDYMKDIRKNNVIEVPVENDWSQYQVSKKFLENVLNIIIVPLEPVKGSSGESKKAILATNDEKMKMISDKLHASVKKITMVYTAQDLSMVGFHYAVNDVSRVLKTLKVLLYRHLG